MASTFASRHANEPKSGGKIVRTRRRAAATPYDRPGVRNSQPENPSWFSKLVVSPSRMIASGAGKLLSSVFSPSSSDADSSSEDESDQEYNDIGNLNQANEIWQETIKTPDAFKHLSRESQITEDKMRTKYLIENLLMQERFTREECDRLIGIINSRVVDYPIEDPKPVQEDKLMPDISGAAVMEARKWFEEKKLGSSEPKSDQRSCDLSSTLLPNTELCESGSPVDVAKLYMQARPPWASPSITHVGYTSPSPTGLKLFMEETLLIGGNLMSSSKKKRETLNSGSWNIRDEIRRVRSKATEEMLKSLPSTKLDWSDLAFGCKSNKNYAEKLKADIGNCTQNSSKLVDSSLKIDTGGTTAHIIQDKSIWCGPEETLSAGNRMQLSDAKPVSERDAADTTVEDLKDCSAINQQQFSVTDRTIQESQNIEVSASKVSFGTRDMMPTNGLCSQEPSISAGQGSQYTHHQNNENHDAFCLDVNPETCELLSLASVEVPFMNEQDAIINCSQNSSSGYGGEASEELYHQDLKVNSEANTDNIAGKRQRKKMSIYSRKGRGRVK